MLTNKQKKKLLKKKHPTTQPAESNYIAQMLKYRDQFAAYPQVKFLINNVIESDHLIKQGLLPQDLPELILPDDIQDQIFKDINGRFKPGDPKGDQLWNELSDALPKLDKQLRSFRDYLESQYGMWAYISAPFIKDLADSIGDSPVLEVMAGNGYISKGLNDLGVKVFPTDSLEWVELIVVGEKNGATDSKAFWQQAHFIKPETAKQLNRHHQPFDLIKDQIYLVD